MLSLMLVGLLFSTGFESGSIAEIREEFAHHACCDHNSQIVSSPTRAGAFAHRTELRRTDLYDQEGWNKGNTPRAEWDMRDRQSEREERWYGFSVYLEQYDYSQQYDYLAQWKSAPAPGVPLALHIFKGAWDLLGGKVRIPVQRGAWTDWVFRLRFSTGADGIIDIWYNGQQVYAFRGENVPAGMSPTVGFKWGVYKAGFPADATSVRPRIVYHDNIRVGDARSSYEEVSPGTPMLPGEYGLLPSPQVLPPPRQFRLLSKP